MLGPAWFLPLTISQVISLSPPLWITQNGDLGVTVQLLPNSQERHLPWDTSYPKTFLTRNWIRSQDLAPWSENQDGLVDKNPCSPELVAPGTRPGPTHEVSERERSWRCIRQRSRGQNFPLAESWPSETPGLWCLSHSADFSKFTRLISNRLKLILCG